MNFQCLLQRMMPFYVLICLHIFHVNLISSNDIGKSNATATHSHIVVECDPGSYFNSTTSQCEACPPGTYQPQAGQSECIPCPQGTFNSESGQIQCQPCQADYFNDQLGAIECQPCPPGTTSNEGSTTCELICENTWITGSFSNCSETCGGGVQTRLVQCVDCNGNVVADSQCADPKPAETQECNTHPCPIDCQVSAWSEWSTCSESCGGGTQCRTRTVLVQPQFGGAPCPVLEECRECNTDPCCENIWSTGSFSICSETCGGGVQTRLLQCVDCSGNVVADSQCADPKPAETQECNTDPCPIDCQVSDWSDWSTCSESCGGGTQCRTRTVLVQPQFGGAPCPVLEECRDCNTQACCDNTWSTGSFSICSETCGGGVQTRLVQCVDCNGNVVADSQCADPKPAETQECNTQPCPIDCQVSAWSEWSTCSDSCGGGTQCRTRTVLVQPQFGGAPCPALEECRECNTDPCDPCQNVNCDDGDPCTQDICENGDCINELISCDDGDPCTVDYCDENGFCKNEPSGLSLEFTIEDANCNGWNGTITPNATGGTPPYTFYDPANSPFTPSYSAPAGVYEISVEDANGCSITQTAEINEPDSLLLELIGVEPLCNGGLGEIIPVITGGTPPYLVLGPDKVFGGSGIFCDLLAQPFPLAEPLLYPPGDYLEFCFMGVADSNLCTYFVLSFTLNEPDELVLNFSIDSPLCHGDSGTIALSATGGTPPYQFYGPANQPIDSIISLVAGDHEITVEDANGCTTTDTITIVDPEPLTIILIPTDASCHDSCDGYIEMWATGLASPLTVIWSNPDPDTLELDVNTYGNGIDELTYVFGGFCAGIYTFEVVDANGCTASGSAEVNEPPSCDDGDPCTNDICENGDCINELKNCDDGDPCTVDYCDENGFCKNEPLNCDDGNPCTDDFCENGNCFYVPVLCDDNDSCTVDFCDTNTGGCIYEVIPDCPTPCTLAVNIDPVLNVYPAYPPASCVTITALTSGGNNPFSYLWSNGGYTESITVCPTTTTNYCVTVTDNNGCEGEYCIEVCVIDISCGNNPNNPKIALCKNGQIDLCVPINAVPGQLNNGAVLGYCGDTTCTQAAMEELIQTEQKGKMHIYPNPFSDRLIFEFMPAADSHVKLEIFNLAGQSLSVLFEGNVGGGEMQYFSYIPTEEIAEGMIIYSLQTEYGNHFGKAILVR